MRLDEKNFHMGTTAVVLHSDCSRLPNRKKKSIGLINERVMLSSENGRADVVKEGVSKFIEKNYTGYIEAICKTKFVNGLSSNFWRHMNSCRYVLIKGRGKPSCFFSACLSHASMYFQYFGSCTPLARSTKCMEWLTVNMSVGRIVCQLKICPPFIGVYYGAWPISSTAS